MAPHHPVTTALASAAEERLAKLPAWPGHAVVQAALSSFQLEPPATGRMNLKHLPLPSGRNQPAGHALLGEGVGDGDNEIEEDREMDAVREGDGDWLGLLV